MKRRKVDPWAFVQYFGQAQHFAITVDRPEGRRARTIEAPFSHAGEILSYSWVITAVEERGGIDQVSEVPITMLP